MSSLDTNFYPFSGVFSGSKTEEFPLAVRSLHITNRSGAEVLNVKFDDKDAYFELAPTEILTMDRVHIRKVIMTSPSGDYRILGKG
mgnify:CR=1 FL=1